MIESVMVDEFRAMMAEQADRGKFKPQPPTATEQVSRLLTQAANVASGQPKRRGAMSIAMAERMAADAAAYDAEVTRR